MKKEFIVTKRRQSEQRRLRKQQQQVVPKWLEDAGADRAALLEKRATLVQPPAQFPNSGPFWAFENESEAHRARGLCAFSSKGGAGCCKVEAAVAEKEASAPATRAAAVAEKEASAPATRSVTEVEAAGAPPSADGCAQ